MANAHAFIAVGLVCCVIGAVNAHIFHKLFDDESQLVQVKPDTYALYSTHLRHIVNVNGEEVFMRNASGDCSSEIKVDRLQKDVWERIESEQTRIHSGRAQRWFAGRYELEKPSKIIDHLEDGFDVEEDKEHQVLKVGKTGLSAPAAGKSAEKYVRVFEFNNIVTLVRANGHVQMLPSHCLNPEEIIVLEEATGAAIKPQEPSEDGSEGLIVMDDDE